MNGEVFKSATALEVWYKKKKKKKEFLKKMLALVFLMLCFVNNILAYAVHIDESAS